VHIQFNGIATREAIRKLINYLEMTIGDFPKNDDDLSTKAWEIGKVALVSLFSSSILR